MGDATRPLSKQDQRAQELKEKVDHAIERLAEQLARGHTEDYLKLLAFWSKFHRYSAANMIVIMRISAGSRRRRSHGLHL